MTEPKLSQEAVRALRAIEGVITVADSNFPRDTNIRIAALGNNEASVTVKSYALREVLAAVPPESAT